MIRPILLSIASNRIAPRNAEGALTDPHRAGAERVV